MKTLSYFSRWLAVLLVAAPLVNADSNPPGNLTYQGFVTGLDGTPLGKNNPTNATIIFRIYSLPTGGDLKWSEEQVVTIDNGHFNALLGEGSPVGIEPNTKNLTSVFLGSDASERYMEITVDTAKILPRLQFLAAPYAFLAHTTASARNLATEFKTSDGIGLPTSDGSTQSGLLTLRPYPDTGLEFGYQLGITADSSGQPSLNIRSSKNNSYGLWSRLLGLKVNNVVSGVDATIAGGSANTASGELATVGGGLANSATGFKSTVAGGHGNLANNNFSFVGGGADNKSQGDGSTVAGGRNNTASGELATVGGGEANSATGFKSTVAGGHGNLANNYFSFVGGGANNKSQGDASTVAGGRNNDATGFASTVAGGAFNSAQGDHSFAAGRRAIAAHNNSFVFSDADWNFQTTAPQQFLIRAGGGVGINTDSPRAPLHVSVGWSQEIAAPLLSTIYD